MSRFVPKPTHGPVREYYDGLAKFVKLGIKHESAVGSAFQSLLVSPCGGVQSML